MIISHQHRYLFIQVPHTGSTAIARELQEHYAGEPILWKHAHLDDFLSAATPEQKGYFTFLTLRNPLDEAVSIYWKLKGDHKGRIARRAPGLSRRDLALADFIRRTDADFAAFFRRAYRRLPHDKWARTQKDRVDFVLRFENLAADFHTLLRRAGIEPVRPLPKVNPTAGREGDFTQYYPPELVPRARAVFGPYMRAVGYEFPADWGDAVPRSAALMFRALSLPRRLYWRRLKWRGRSLPRRQARARGTAAPDG